MLQRILVPLILLTALFGGLQFMPSRATANGAECPQVTVTGSQGKGRIALFSAQVAPTADRATYNWSVSAGALQTGQGTSAIEVADVGGDIVTATVEVFGLPRECIQAAGSTVIFE